MSFCAVCRIAVTPQTFGRMNSTAFLFHTANQIVQKSADDLYFTDEKYEYGAIPSHLNEIENQRIAEKIEEAL